MRLTGIDPHALLLWAQEAYEHTAPGETVDLHVLPTHWELRAIDTKSLIIEPEAAPVNAPVNARAETPAPVGVRARRAPAQDDAVDLGPARFTHDCDHCVYLGRWRGQDTYWCPQGGMSTIVLRWGHAGPEYESGTHLAGGLPNVLRYRALVAEAGLPLDASTGTEPRDV
jgi:hypothetical protein